MRLLPSDDGCYVCGKLNKKGLKRFFYIDEDGFVMTYFKGVVDYMGHGSIHGGLSAALLDEAMGLSATYFKGVLCVTAEITVRYLKPLHIESRYTVRGRMVNDKKLLCEAYGEIIDERENKHVRAYGKYVPVPEEQFYELYQDLFKKQT